MNAEQFSSALGRVNDKYIMEAVTYKRVKKSGWLKWGSVAACLCLILTAVVMTLPGILKELGGDVAPVEPVVSSQVSLFDYMTQMNLKAEKIDDPQFFEDMEMPVVTKDQIRAAIENNITVQGTITSLNSVRVQDSNTIWYITTMTIAVEEVLNGKADSEIHIVCASSYRGMLDSNLVPAPGISGCYEGMRSVFVLKDIYTGPWMIAGAEIYPSILGEYSVQYQLERDGNVLIFADQNIAVGLDEIASLPDRGSEPIKYPDTTIVPGFDLDEPDEPDTP